MTERLSFSSPASSSHALDNQGLEKQESQEEKKKKGETLNICYWDQKYISQPPEAVMREVKKVCEEEMLTALAVKHKSCSE